MIPNAAAQLLVRAGVVRGMQLDINPTWTVFVSYAPRTAGGFASASNGSKLLPSTMQGRWTFFTPSRARDFITMSARTADECLRARHPWPGRSGQGGSRRPLTRAAAPRTLPSRVIRSRACAWPST